MKYVDHILKYLEGELDKEDKASFENEMKHNPELKDELDQTRLVYEALEEVLKADSDQVQDRQKFVEDILADHDIHTFSGPPNNPDEKQVESLIRESMKLPEKKAGAKSRTVFLRSLLLTAVAASVAFLVWILAPDPPPDKLFSNFFKPLEDKILVHYAEFSRGEVQTGVQFYFAGRYREAADILGEQLNTYQPDPYISLFYVLACLEIGCDENLMNILTQDFSGTNKEVQAAITWYSALYSLNQGESESARDILSALVLFENPYKHPAKKLLRKLE